jgi:glycosyltransferase involved in cell wall biosynthesis
MLVSVIIPCYNVREFVTECVESVLNQTYKDIEIICIDNNSNDETWDFLEKLNDKYSQLIIDKELKPGAPAARNRGLALAKGEWIQFLDADDLLMRTKIEQQIKLIQLNCKSNIAFISAACKRVNLKGSEKIMSDIEPNVFLAPFVNRCGNTCSNLWKRENIMSIGEWSEDIKSSQETDLMMRLILNNYTYICDSEPLTIIRERTSGQISQRNPSEKWKLYIDVRLKYIVNLKGKFPDEYLKIHGILYDFLMVSVITLGKYDRVAAEYYYKTFIKKNWNSSYAFGFNRLKVALVKVFGVKILIR